MKHLVMLLGGLIATSALAQSNADPSSLPPPVTLTAVDDIKRLAALRAWAQAARPRD